MRRERRAALAEQGGRRVVSGRKPTVAKPSDAAQAGGGPPAGDPHRGPVGADRTWFELRVPTEQGSKRADRLVEELPPLFERKADSGVVACRRPGPDAG